MNDKISAITVTRNRVDLLKKCIQYYIDQTWNNKELLILYYDDDYNTKTYLLSLDKDFKKHNNIRVFNYIPIENMYLGGLRNYIISKATGDYIIVWDDDDYHHPKRMSMQISNIEPLKYACTLQSVYVFSEFNQDLKRTPNRLEGWENTLLCRKDKMPLYRNLPKHEDTPVLFKLNKDNLVTSIDVPSLYVYRLHDSNISSNIHKNKLWINSKHIENPYHSYNYKKLLNFIK